MVLYTIEPYDKIFPQEPCERQFVDVGGAMIEGMSGENGLQITRLISTDPKMYLDKRYAPGAYYTNRS